MLVAAIIISSILLAGIAYFLLRKPVVQHPHQEWLELERESEAQAHLALLSRFDLPRDSR